MNHGIKALTHAPPKDIRILTGQILLLEHPGPDCIVNVMVNIGNLIRQPDNGALQGGGVPRGPVVQDPVPYFPRQVQALPILFQHLHDAHALLIMRKPILTDLIQYVFPGMAKGGVP